MNLPNKLTVARIMMTPFFILFLAIGSVGARICALVIFLAASLTDLWDGVIARRSGQITSFGKLMDPLADKLIICAAFISFAGMRDMGIPAWPVVLIVTREIIITDMRKEALRGSRVIDASKAGKYKTTVQIVVIVIILLLSILKGLRVTEKLPYYLVLFTMLLTVYSGAEYILNNKRVFLAE